MGLVAWFGQEQVALRPEHWNLSHQGKWLTFWNPLRKPIIFWSRNPSQEKPFQVCHNSDGGVSKWPICRFVGPWAIWPTSVADYVQWDKSDPLVSNIWLRIIFIFCCIKISISPVNLHCFGSAYPTSDQAGERLAWKCNWVYNQLVTKLSTVKIQSRLTNPHPRELRQTLKSQNTTQQIQ